MYICYFDYFFSILFFWARKGILSKLLVVVLPFFHKDPIYSHVIQEFIHRTWNAEIAILH